MYSIGNLHMCTKNTRARIFIVALIVRARMGVTIWMGNGLRRLMFEHLVSLFYVGASLGEVCFGGYSPPSCFLIHQEVSKQPHSIAITSVRHSHCHASLMMDCALKPWAEIHGSSLMWLLEGNLVANVRKVANTMRRDLVVFRWEIVKIVYNYIAKESANILHRGSESKFVGLGRVWALITATFKVTAVF